MRPASNWYQTLSSVLLALILALLVWILATTERLQRYTFPPIQQPGLEIELTNLGEGLTIIEGEGQEARAEMLIDRRRLGDLRRSDLTAMADLSGLGPGVSQVAVQIEPQPFAPPFNLLNPDPDRIFVRLDEVMTRTFDVDTAIPDLSSLPPNYQVLTPTVEPPSVTISGPRTLVQPIEQVAAEVVLGSTRETIEQGVDLQIAGLAPSAEGRVRVSTERVTVTVPIEPRPGYRDLIVSPNVEGDPVSGYWVSDVDYTPQLVTVVGQPDLIAQLDSFVTTAPVDVAGQGGGEIIREVPLQLPDGVSPLEDGFVEVRVKIEPQTSSRRLSLTPSVTGLQPGLVVTDSAIVPSSVTVLLKGPITDLESLTPEDVAVTLDATGLGVGTHLIEPEVRTPIAILAESINPQVVEITITEEEVTRSFETLLQARGATTDEVVVREPRLVTLDVRGPASTVDTMPSDAVTALLPVGALAVGVPSMVTPTVVLTDPLSLVTSLAPVQVTVYNVGDVLVVLAPVTVQGLADGLRATVDPAMVRVRVAGPGDTATLARSETFAVTVDLTGLGSGTYPLRPRVQLPPGYSLADLEPEVVSVRLVEVP